MVRPERFERPTYWFVASCSIQLSYGRTLRFGCNSLKISEFSGWGNRWKEILGAPGEIRTPDPLVRSQMLYPAELRARGEGVQHSRFAVCWQMELLLGCRCRFRLGEREHGHGFDDIEARPAQKLVNGGLAEAGSIVLDADRLLVFAELDAADAVDFADFGDGEGGCLGGTRSIAIQDVKLGHKTMI